MNEFEIRNAIIAILQIVRDYNPVIGYYEQHVVNENFNYTVRLDNGRIKISRELVQDAQFNYPIPNERLDAILRTFVADNPIIEPPTANFELNNPVVEPQIVPKISFFKRILKLLGFIN